jgi:exonuclease III
MNTTSIKICSFNANGLADPRNQARTFKWLKKQSKGIIMIQEASPQHT